VELRTTHAHGIEVELSAEERKKVRQRFKDSPVELASLGSAFEYHSTDPSEVKQNIEGTKRYAELARDVGASGIKVRPNGLQTDAGIPIDTTLEQIGNSLRECAEHAAKVGIKIRLEVHGKETCKVPHIRKILDYADSENLYLCWNSNQTDLTGNGLEENYRLVADRIDFVHMRDLSLAEYPWSSMLSLLAASGYSGFCCAEIPESTDPLRVMAYYRALFDSYRP
jgi:sugar phosphate isomerase/epimerase